MLYGSQTSGTEMSNFCRSHQFTGAFVTTQQCQSMIAPTYSREAKRQLQKCYLKIASQGKGHHDPAEMPFMVHPSRLVYGSQLRCTEMSNLCRFHQLGEGHTRHAEMPVVTRPSRPVLGHVSIAEMPHLLRPILTRGQQRAAEMPSNSRLAREGSHDLHTVVSFSAHPSQPVYGSHLVNTAMLMNDRSHQFWANPSTQKCREVDAHQLGKDIICTLIKPLLFLPFLLIYGRITKRSQKCPCEHTLPPVLGRT